MAQNPFGRKAPPPPHDYSEDIKDVTSRIRVLEERFNNFTKKVGIIEQNMLSTNKRTSAQVKDINTDLSEMKNSLNEVKDRLRELISAQLLQSERGWQWRVA